MEAEKAPASTSMYRAMGEELTPASSFPTRQQNASVQGSQAVRASVVITLLLGSAGSAAPACAQDSTWRPVPDTVQKNTVQVWGGYSPGSVRLFGLIRGVRFAEAGVRYQRILARSADGTHAIDYVGEFLPVARMTYDPVRGAPAAAVARGERTLYGLGLTPAGLRLRGTGGASWWQPYLEGGLGFVYFFAPLPDRRGKRFNFTIRVGLGVRLRLGRGAAFTLGYRYHHLSNGFRGRINPGFDSNVFHLGVTVARF